MATSDNTTKICTKCGVEYPATPEYFHKEKRGKLGLKSVCKPCESIYQKQWWENHPEKRSEYQESGKESHRKSTREWAQRKRAEDPDYDRNLYKANPQPRKKAIAKWRENNKPQYNAAVGRWRDKNRDAVNARARIRYTENLDHSRLIARLKMRGRKIPLNIQRDVFADSDGRCTYCGITLMWNIPYDFSIDHIEPKIKGGTNDRENLVAACQYCNGSKADKPLDQWIKERGW